MSTINAHDQWLRERGWRRDGAFWSHPSHDYCTASEDEAVEMERVLRPDGRIPERQWWWAS